MDMCICVYKMISMTIEDITGKNVLQERLLKDGFLEYAIFKWDIDKIKKLVRWQIRKKKSVLK